VKLSVEQFRTELPNLTVRFQGKVYEGLVRGRMCRFPQVSILVDGSYISNEYTWEGLTQCYNEDRIVTF
jgi:hypothetical protein